MKNSDIRPASDSLDDLVSQWVPLPDVAEALDITITQVRSMLDEGMLVAVKRGKPKVWRVPHEIFTPQPCEHLPGTLTLLFDAGLTAEEAVRWLFTPDTSLPGTPWTNLVEGHKTEVRRRAQALLL